METTSGDVSAHALATFSTVLATQARNALSALSHAVNMHLYQLGALPDPAPTTAEVRADGAATWATQAVALLHERVDRQRSHPGLPATEIWALCEAIEDGLTAAQVTPLELSAMPQVPPERRAAIAMVSQKLIDLRGLVRQHADTCRRVLAAPGPRTPAGRVWLAASDALSALVVAPPAEGSSSATRVNAILRAVVTEHRPALEGSVSGLQQHVLDPQMSSTAATAAAGQVTAAARAVVDALDARIPQAVNQCRVEMQGWELTNLQRDLEAVVRVVNACRLVLAVTTPETPAGSTCIAHRDALTMLIGPYVGGDATDETAGPSMDGAGPRGSRRVPDQLADYMLPTGREEVAALAAALSAAPDASLYSGYVRPFLVSTIDIVNKGAFRVALDLDETEQAWGRWRRSPRPLANTNYMRDVIDSYLQLGNTLEAVADSLRAAGAHDMAVDSTPLPPNTSLNEFRHTCVAVGHMAADVLSACRPFCSDLTWTVVSPEQWGIVAGAQPDPMPAHTDSEEMDTNHAEAHAEHVAEVDTGAYTDPAHSAAMELDPRDPTWGVEDPDGDPQRHPENY